MMVQIQCFVFAVWLMSTAVLGVDTNFKMVSIGKAGEWAIDSSDGIYHISSGYDWVGGSLSQLDVGSTSVWGVNSADMVYYRAGVSNANDKGTHWVEIPKLKLHHVTVSQKGHVWGVSKAQAIYHRVGASNTNVGGTSWKRIAGALTQLSLGCRGLWGVNRGNLVYYRKGTTGDPDTDTHGTAWQYVTGLKLKYMTSGMDVFGVGLQNQVYHRQGITAAVPHGTEWLATQYLFRQIDLMDYYLMGVSHAYQIEFYEIKPDDRDIGCCVWQLGKL